MSNGQGSTQSALCLPSITTDTASAVGLDSALIGGNITNDGGSSIILRGVCYSTSPNPNMGNPRTEDGLGIGSFNSVLRGLTSSTTYYARSYAKNSNGVVVYGNEVGFTTTASLPGVRCPGTPIVTDIDGNLYYTVQIGTQCWTQSNLKVSKYRNGDNILTGLSNSDWGNTTSGAYAIYNNDPVNDGLYGKLYNHYAVTDSRGLCPTGWHVPTDGEYNVLITYLDSNCINCGHSSAIAGGSLMSPVGWNLQQSSWITNSSGFTALPGGVRSSFGYFDGMTDYGYWWSSSVSSASTAWHRSMLRYANGIIRGSYLDRINGFSVRCLKNTTLPHVITTSVTNVNISTALVTGEVISDGDTNTERGFCYATTSNPTLSNDTTMNGMGTGVYLGVLQNLTPSTTYYFRAYATNSVGTSYGAELSFTTVVSLPGVRCPGTPTVTDFDGNVYNTVQIGNQCWTQSNLKVSKYRNGDSIPTGLSNSAWQNTTLGAYAIYNNDPVNDIFYGKLYNHYAVTDSRGLCPTGWHVPTDGEWTDLVKYIDPNADTVCYECTQSGMAVGALKSTARQPIPFGWDFPNTGATNTSGFTALPGGQRAYDGPYYMSTSHGFWWSSSVSSASTAWSRYLSFNLIGSLNGSRINGSSVRCLKNTLPQVNTISAPSVTPSMALLNGEIISEGDANTIRGFCYSTTPNPTISDDTTMNGMGHGVYSEILQNLTPSTTYYFKAYATNSVGTSYGAELSFTTVVSLPGVRCPGTPTVTDFDGNVYNTVQIGNQCWTQSNLKVSKYRNGDSIPTGLSNSAWQNTTLGAYAIYNNDLVNDSLYGKLYNHYAVTDSRGLCPTGWHVPTDGEWNILVRYLDSNADTVSNNWSQSSIAGGALKSTAMQPIPGGWGSPNTGATNTSGFTALPGGFRVESGGLGNLTYMGFWWSSSVSSVSEAWDRVLIAYNSHLSRSSNDRANGFSVRCLKD